MAEGLVGRKLLNGEYELREILGRGGMATVHRAYSRSLDTDVAVKVLAPRLAGTPLYMSPEQRTGGPVDGRGDQYSLAITTYELDGANRFAVDPQNGAYYTNLWRGAIATNPEIISISSWNEWMEGHYIEPSQKYGDLFLRLTPKQVQAYEKSRCG